MTTLLQAPNGWRRPGHHMLRLVSAIMVAACSIWAVGTLQFPLIVKTLAWADLFELIALAPALILVVWGLRALRWYAVLYRPGERLDPLLLYLQTCVAIGIGTVTPAQAGEVMKIAYAQRMCGISAGQAAGAFVVERIADAAVLLVLTYLALLLVPFALAGAVVPALAVAIAAALAFASMIFMTAAKRGWLPAAVLQVAATIRALATSARHVTAVMLLTVCCWLLSALLWQLTMAAVGVHVTIAAAMAIVGLATLASLAAMIPAGLVVSELTISGVLIALGFAPEQSLAAALMLRMLSVWGLVLGLIHWLVLRSLTRSGPHPAKSRLAPLAGSASVDKIAC